MSASSQSALALEVKDLSISVISGASAGQTILKNAQLALPAGERLTIVGESGAGKSILAQAIMGTLPSALAASGSVKIQGAATNGQRPLTQPLWGKVITMLPQEPWSALGSLMRMQSQVAESAHYAGGRSWPEARRLAQSSMAQLNVAHAAPQWLHQISGGMAQRVGVASAALSPAAILLADEPTKGLDPSACGHVAQTLLQAQRSGQALLTITHDLDLAQQLGGQVLVMKQGEVVESGLADEVFARPQHAYTRALIAAQPLNWPRLAAENVDDKQLVVSGDDLAKSFAQRHLFKGVSLSLARGEILALPGPSGCGKTTLGNVLLGLVAPDAGHVQKQNLPAWKFQKLYQDPPAAFAPQRRLGDALQDLIKLHRLDATRIAPLLHELHLHEGLLSRLPSEVSGGELQRMALLRLLLLEPAFIFADEPTSRLDVITQQDTMALLCQAAQQHDCAVMLVSHDADLARASSHRVLSLFEPA
jgi:ABC-type glutathione transport system ATPase component